MCPVLYSVADQHSRRTQTACLHCTGGTHGEDRQEALRAPSLQADEQDLQRDAVGSAPAREPELACRQR